MANKEIVDLTNQASPATSDVLELQRPPGGAGTSFKVLLSALKALITTSLGGADKRVLFQDGTAARGDAGLTYDKTAKALSLNGSANSLTTAGSTTGNPVTLTASGSDASVPIKLAPKGPQGYTQLGPDTYGVAGWAGYTISAEIYDASIATANANLVYMEAVAGDILNSNISACQFLANTQAGGTNDVFSVVGIAGYAQSSLGAGRTAANLLGVQTRVYATGGGTATYAASSYSIVTTDGGSTIGAGYGYSITIQDLSPSNNTSKAYGFYSEFTNSNTLAEGYGFWSGEIGPKATNPYPFWSDEQGVFRIKADNTFDSVYQSIPALYNPQFTKYTPGAADYERIVLGQWNGNVAEIGTEAGGTGVLRPLKFIGAAPTVTGSRGGNAALADLLTKLATLGLIIDGTS